MYDPVETTSIWADDELDVDDEDDEELLAEGLAAEVPVDDAPSEELPEADDPDDDAPEEALDPVTCWPTVRLTAATVPAMVDVRVASLSEVCALVT
jgi:hypothetical protein